MNEKTINDLDLLTSVDRSADFFEVADASDLNASKRTSVNSMLNLTSQPLGLTDIQSPTNKTFDNTNIATLRDDRFTLQDSGDTTKQAVFQLSGITTATTRTYTLPDRSDTLVTLGGSQTLTDKTLTSPTLTSPLINNPTLNTDAISEFTSANGVTIDGLNIKDGKLNTNNSIVASNITDAIITNAKLSTATGEPGGAWEDYTPTISTSSGSFTSVSATGKWKRIGKTIFYRLTITITTVGSATNVRFSLPATAAAPANTVIGYGRETASTGKMLQTVINNATTGTVFYYDNSIPTANGLSLSLSGHFEEA
jgi:hypothetical protein